jgi:arginyl-tRNA synthetase
VADALPKKIFSKVEVVKPGLINMTLAHKYKTKIIDEILKEADKYGNFKNKKLFYNIEFISANPTGLLHIGHARNGAIGDSLARIWKAYGIDVNREYYINDGGGQINRLGMSTLVRYKQALGQNVELPEDSYHGEEIIEVAEKIKSEIGDKYANVEFDKDTIIKNETAQEYFNTYAKNYMLDIIKKTLDVFDVKIDI